MTDLRPFLPVLYDLYSAQSSQKASALYTQIKAKGAESFEIQFHNGRVLNTHAWSDLEISMLTAQKKGRSWKTAREIAQNMTVLTDWEKTRERMLNAAKAQDDPRPAFRAYPKLETKPQKLLRYDPQVASELPALVFHRAFQTFEPLLKKGFVMDAICTWHHGGRTWQNSALPFAWCDNHGFCFLPQTRMDETIAIYAPDNPRKRRYLAFSNYKLSEIIQPHLWAEQVQKTHQQPWIDWNMRQFDCIILMPHVMAKILCWLMKRMSTDAQFLKQIDGNLLDERLALFDDPDDPAFRLHGLIASDGTPLKSSPVITENRIASAFKTTSSPEIFCPVLRSYSPSQTDSDKKQPIPENNYPTQAPDPSSYTDIELDMSQFIPEKISTRIPGRALFIEHAQILDTETKNPRLYLPTGAILCRNGKCLGHVVPPTQPLDMLSLLKNAASITQTLRIGGIACCGVAHEPA